MKLEDQVVSLELAKKMKELGFKQESLFWWFNIGYPQSWRLCERILDKDAIKGWKYKEKNDKENTIVSAYTVAELGEMLPPDTPSERVSDKTSICWMQMSEDGDTYWDEKSQELNEETDYNIFKADTEANARAKMLIHLKENKLI